MNVIDYIILFTVLASCVFTWLDNRLTRKREIHLINKWADAEQECATWISMYQDELAQNRILSKELEQYRNHQEEA
jgi:hypothetical protein